MNRELIKFLDADLEVDDVLEQMILKLDETERDELKLALLEHDTWTTEFCPALVGVGTGNEALYTMGSGSSAKAVFVYCCTYVTKNCAELSAVLSLLYDAKVHIFVPIHHDARCMWRLTNQLPQTLALRAAMLATSLPDC